MKRVLVGAVGVLLLAAYSVGVAYADCPDSRIACVKIVGGKINRDNKKGVVQTGNCYKNWASGCELCDDHATIAGKCNSQIPTCENNCAACFGDTTGYPYPPCYDKTGAGVPW